MLYDTEAPNPCFPQGRAPENIEDLLATIRRELGLNGARPWRLISARRKFGKVLFEIEEDQRGGCRRLIGKVASAERADMLFHALKLLRAEGFRPPARYIVPEAIAYLPGRAFVLQEKAAGTPVSELISADASAAAIAAAEQSARWLAALHGSKLEGVPAKSGNLPVTRWAEELRARLPFEATRIDSIAEAVCREQSGMPCPFVPCHGDFHPMNIFIAGSKCVTAIDLDKFSLREAEFDVGSFAAQTSAFDYFQHGSFDRTRDVRRAFVDRYQHESRRPLRARRVGMYTAAVFLKNLHFELVLLKTGRTEYVDPWLSSAAAAIETGTLS